MSLGFSRLRKSLPLPEESNKRCDKKTCFEVFRTLDRPRFTDSACHIASCISIQVNSSPAASDLYPLMSFAAYVWRAVRRSTRLHPLLRGTLVPDLCSAPAPAEPSRPG